MKKLMSEQKWNEIHALKQQMQIEIDSWCNSYLADDGQPIQ